jgi:hypothetical protein
LHPQPKDRRKVPITAELREALAELHELIEQAKHDPDVNLGFDDAVQLPCLCGGMFGRKNRPFVLTYFPTCEADRGRWFLTLHPTEIEDVADGRQTDMLLYCCTSPDCRTKFREADDHCFHCDYIDE